MRLFILPIIFCLISVFGQAQGLRLGLSTGLNSQIILDEGIKSDPRYQTSFNYSFSPVGLNVSYDLTPGFGLSIESIYSRQETIYELIDIANAVRGEHKLDASFLNVPVLMRFMSSGNAATRFNFNFGPQFSFLTSAVESIDAEAGIYQMPEDITFEQVLDDYPTATQTSGQANLNQYELPSDHFRELLTREANEFRNMDFQIAMAMGLDIDIAKHFILITQLRANYSIDGFRNEDAIDAIINGQAQQLFAEKANLTVGVQIGIQYSFKLTRAFAKKALAE